MLDCIGALKDSAKAAYSSGRCAKSRESVSNMMEQNDVTGRWTTCSHIAVVDMVFQYKYLLTATVLIYMWIHWFKFMYMWR